MSDPRLEMFAWLATADARAAASSELHRRGLPAALVDDLLQATALAIAATDEPNVAAVDAPVAYARRALARKTVDLLRGTIRERARQQAWPDDLDVAGDDDADASAARVVAEAEDAMRRALHLLVGTRRPAVAAAALTVLTLGLHRDVAVPRAVPVPDGAGAAQADRWAALWLAGERDCFPTESAVEDAAMRQRRSRALRSVAALLEEAAASIGLESTRG